MVFQRFVKLLIEDLLSIRLLNPKMAKKLTLVNYKKKKVGFTYGGGEIDRPIEKRKNCLEEARFLDGSPTKEEYQVIGFKD